MSSTKVLGYLLKASLLTHLRPAVKTPVQSLAAFTRRLPSHLVRNRHLEQEMSVVYEVGRIVTSTLDIQQVYDEFATQLKKLVDFSRISLMTVDRSKGTLQVKYAIQEGRLNPRQERVWRLEGTRTQLVTESGETLIQEDISADPPFPSDHLVLEPEFVTCIVVPLTGKEGVLGTMNLFSTKPGAFGMREKAILEVLANQIAPAVENARLYEESIESQKAFQGSDARFRRLMAQAADPLFLTGPDGKLVDVNDLACQGLGYTREELLGMRVSDFSAGVLSEENKKRLLAGEIIMVETRHRRNDGTTFPAEIRVCMIELDGQQYRSAVARDITERKRAEEDQVRLAQEDMVMAEIGRIISSSLDLSEVYEPLGREIQILIPFEFMNLAILQPDGKSFLPGWILGAVTPRHRSGVPTPLDGTMAGKVIQTGAPIIFEAESEEQRVREFPKMSHAIGSGLRSFLSVPLISRGSIIAVLQLRTQKPKAYSQRHLDLAVRIANQISGAISASQVFQQQKNSQERITASLYEKEVLLKEINHRVKNNLQIISSLLNLQSNDIHDDMVPEILRATQGRIRAMATIHEKLYQSEDMAQIDFGEYLESLANDILKTYGVNPRQVELKVEAPGTLLGVDSAIPCGLIVNELVSNALKHAFPGRRQGMIQVGMSTNEYHHQLTVRDNGVGLPDWLDFEHSKTLGLRLVNAWVEQLGGTMELRRDEGVEFTIAFSGR